MLLLTIDDAPSPATALLLEELQRQQIQAIFFCLGRNLEAYPQTAIEMIRAGHILGNHAFSHTAFSQLSCANACAEIDRTEKLLDQLHRQAGVARTVKLFRFPYGDPGSGVGFLRRICGIVHPKRYALQRKLRQDGFQSPHQFCAPLLKSLPRLNWPMRIYDQGCDWLWHIDPKDWQWQSDRTPEHPSIPAIGAQQLQILLLHDFARGQEYRVAYIRKLAEKGIVRNLRTSMD